MTINPWLNITWSNVTQWFLNNYGKFTILKTYCNSACSVVQS